MFKKNLVIYSVIVMLISVLSGCGGSRVIPQEETEEIETVGNNETSDKQEESVSNRNFRVGTEVSDAYVDPDTVKISEDAKAVGYEYDRDKLVYELVWYDEFDYEGLPDSTKWSYDTGGSGWGNHELQYYTAGDNVNVSDGVMTIELRQEEKGACEYTSTRLVSRQKGDWLYCKVEVRAKLPSGKGTWPAIWMLPTDYVYGGWPKSGEIDIMEHVGYDQDRIYTTVHTDKFHGGSGKGGSKVIEGVSEDFHVYGVEWLPDCIIFSIDGEDMFTYKPTNYTMSPDSSVWPFDKRMHLLINLAFGGDWGGARGVEPEVLPATFEVDYVRVYQCDEFKNGGIYE